MFAQSEKTRIIVESDANAFVFTDVDEQAPSTPANRDAPMPARILDEIKAFLPTVKRIRPVEAELQSGRKLKLYAPAALN